MRSRSCLPGFHLAVSMATTNIYVPRTTEEHLGWQSVAHELDIGYWQVFYAGGRVRPGQNQSRNILKARMLRSQNRDFAISSFLNHWTDSPSRKIDWSFSRRSSEKGSGTS